MSIPEYGPLWEDEYSAALEDIDLNGHKPLERDDLPHNSWQRINLNDPQYKIPPDPPTILGLIYAGKRHVVSGPPESTKTLIIYICALKAIRDGKRVALIDFEMGPNAAALLLTEIGATPDQIDSIYFVTPTEPPGDELEHLIAWGANIVIIDAAVGAYDASHLDDNGRKDAEIFARTWIRPLWKAGITTILLDHVTKDTETRGKFTIGSERKVGQADVHLGMEAIKALSRGSSGLIRVHVHKDRPGFLPRPTATIFEIQSNPVDNHITWAQQDPAPTDTDTGEFLPTKLMERVSKHLEQLTEPASMTSLEENVQGNAKYIRQAAEALVHQGYATEQPGPRKARLITTKKPYRQPPETTPSTTPSNPVPVPVRTESTTPSSTPSPPLGGDGYGGRPPDSPETENPVQNWDELREQYADELGDNT